MARDVSRGDGAQGRNSQGAQGGLPVGKAGHSRTEMRRGIVDVQDDQDGLRDQLARIGPADWKVGRHQHCAGKMAEKGFHVDKGCTKALKMNYARNPGVNFGASIVYRGVEEVARSQQSLLRTLRSKGKQGDAALPGGTADPARGAFACVGDCDGSLLLELVVGSSCGVDLNLWISRRSLKV